MSRRFVLLNPGPVNVTPRVRKALLRPDICHREPEFNALLASVRRKLLKIFKIENTHTAAFFSGSGTTALEAMLSSIVREKKEVLVLSNGVYGERMKNILEIYGSRVLVLRESIGSFPSPAAIEKAMKSPSIHAVAMVHHETSSGMLNPLRTVGQLAKKYKKTFLVDAISSLGAEAIDFQKDGIDFLAGTSGKCLHGFPGVSFVMVSKKKLSSVSKEPSSLTLDLAATLESDRAGETRFTPVVQIFYAFDEALSELQKEGLSNRIESYRQKSERLMRGFRELGLVFLVGSDYRSHVLTALWTPSNISYEKLHDALKKKGFVIYAGQSGLKGKIFRIANLGDVSFHDIERLLRELKKILKA
jgi:2-aminoethylphosphonate-pyruvate transaminase